MPRCRGPGRGGTRENGGRITGDPVAAEDRATIDVAYEVRPMMDAEDGPVIYLLDEPGLIPPGLDPAAEDDLPTNKRLHLGIEVSFSVTMRVPGHEETRAARKRVLREAGRGRAAAGLPGLTAR